MYKDDFPLRTLPPREFPPELREIPDTPEQLFVRGTLPSTEYKFLCVVGSRAASPYARRATHTLIAGLAGAPVAIISGLALGIDGDAHEAALQAGLPTVAVLPSSADDASIYPSSHKPLAASILRAGGALLSENEAPSKPKQYSFAERNRVMAGMSHATLIVEASEKSGTLITARLALDYNREVLVVPHEILGSHGAGGNALLRVGATLVRNSDDILEALGLTAAPRQTTLPTDLSEAEAQLLVLLSQGALTREEMLDTVTIPTSEANIALMQLIIRGLLVERFGKVERT